LKTQVAYTPTPTTTNLVANNGSAAETYPGDPVSVDLNIQNAENLYAAQALCEADPSVLELQDGQFGDFFDPTLRLIAANQTDAAAGEWLGAISQQNPAGPLSGNGLLATISYVATASGTTSLTCEPLFSDRNGFSLPVSFASSDITVMPFAVASGMAKYQGHTDHTGITITASGPFMQTTATDSTGNFVLDLKTGTYTVTASAPGYLTNSTTISVTSGQPITLSATTLKGGNVNGDNAINISDVTLVAANFGLTVPPADSRADINADGIVNVLDLAILGGNYGLSGTQGW